MKIRHDDGREVVGVTVFDKSFDEDSGQYINIAWEKDKAVYLHWKGWAEVHEPRWVNCTAGVEIGPGPEEGWQYLTRKNHSWGWDSIATLHGKGYQIKEVDRYNLPGNLEQRLEQETRLTGIEAREVAHWLKLFEGPCLIIERKEEG